MEESFTKSEGNTIDSTDLPESLAEAKRMAQEAVGKAGIELPESKGPKIRERCQRTLKYTFSELEKKDISDQMARAVLERDNAISELKSVKGQFDARRKEAEAAISSCAFMLQSGYEYRQTDCEIIKDFGSGTITTVRLDTDEIVENRKMTMADRQMSISD